MSAILIVLVLAALGVGVVAWAARRRRSRPYEQRAELDTAWNDPVAPASDKTPPPSEPRP